MRIAKSVARHVLYKLDKYFDKISYLFSYSIVYLKSKICNYLDDFDEYQGNVDMASKSTACIFAHFDKHGVIDDYVVFYLTKLYELGCAIIFVSTCNKMSQNEIDKIKNIVSKIIIRRNIGYDFGSYAVGFQIASLHPGFDKYIITNDSVYGPLANLEKLITKIDEGNIDALGITDSWQQAYHLQSYFLILNKKVISHKSVIYFWRNILFSNNKKFIIKKYEVGFSQLLLSLGFKIEAYCKYDDISRFVIKRKLSAYNSPKQQLHHHYHTYHNSSHFFWDILITDFDCPFVKTELLRDNPTKITNIWSWQDLLETKINFYPKVIENINNHLKRSRTQKY
jgi:lipopolysaccharide biosynthesis protein